MYGKNLVEGEGGFLKNRKKSERLLWTISQKIAKKSKLTYVNLFNGSMDVLVTKIYHQFHYDPQIFVLNRVEVSALNIVSIEF